MLGAMALPCQFNKTAFYIEFFQINKKIKNKIEKWRDRRDRRDAALEAA